MGSKLVGWSSTGQSLIYTQVPGDLVNMQILTGSELGPETAFLTRFQVVLTLLVFPPFCEHQGLGYLFSTVAAYQTHWRA